MSYLLSYGRLPDFLLDEDDDIKRMSDLFPEPKA
jgi:hypothetical protein